MQALRNWLNIYLEFALLTILSDLNMEQNWEELILPVIGSAYRLNSKKI
jgi:hypothetical protein